MLGAELVIGSKEGFWGFHGLQNVWKVVGCSLLKKRKYGSLFGILVLKLVEALGLVYMFRWFFANVRSLTSLRMVLCSFIVENTRCVGPPFGVMNISGQKGYGRLFSSKFCKSEFDDGKIE
jgi:hypothetical protein